MKFYRLAEKVIGLSLGVAVMTIAGATDIFEKGSGIRLGNDEKSSGELNQDAPKATAGDKMESIPSCYDGGSGGGGGKCF